MARRSSRSRRHDEHALLTIARMEFTATGAGLVDSSVHAAYALMTSRWRMRRASSAKPNPAKPSPDLLSPCLPLALMLVPLAALPDWVTARRDRRRDQFPARRSLCRVGSTLVGNWLGQAAALSTSLVAGFGTGGAIGRSYRARMMSADSASSSRRAGRGDRLPVDRDAHRRDRVTRSAAMGLAAFVWFVAVILYDAAMLSVAVLASGTTVPLLFVSVFGNVVDLVQGAHAAARGHAPRARRRRRKLASGLGRPGRHGAVDICPAGVDFHPLAVLRGFERAICEMGWAGMTPSYPPGAAVLKSEATTTPAARIRPVFHRLACPHAHLGRHAGG